MLHKIRELPARYALEFRAVIKARIRFADCHHVEYANGIGLFEPINDFACVFVAPDTLHVFEHAIGSNPDKKRARIFAGLLFAQLAEEQAQGTA